jgi:4-amino-4-deoxy-L-arabinose transferase-like glycosyltransferase
MLARVTKDKLVLFTVVSLLIVHTGLLAWSAWRHSPVLAEVGHLPAGISHWRFGRFDLYRVNPPLVRMVAALPVLLAGPATDWKSYSTDATTRSENVVGDAFVNANGPRTFWLYTLGRWACIPFGWVGAWLCYRWARDLYGMASGLLAMTLWCFCPNILGHGSLMMPDMPVAALGACACYTFWRWLRDPTWARSITAGVVLGLAELTKTTLIVFYPLWPILWLAYRVSGPRRMSASDWLREGGMLTASMLIGIYVINLGYRFDGSFRRLGDYRFESHTLNGFAGDDHTHAVGNRFRDTWLGALPLPMPANYVQGIDAQKFDFELGIRSYLRGRWSQHGWWYYYLYGLAIKVPLGTWVLVVLAVIASLYARGHVISWRDEMLVLTLLLVILAFVGSQTGFSVHFRYVLPIFPFLFILASKAAIAVTRDRRILASLVAAALLWSVLSSLWYYPHSLSYFNEVVGGPERGHEHLLESNIAWGQDLLYLKEWYDAHLDARPFYLAAVGPIDPRLAGIESEPSRSGSGSPILRKETDQQSPGLPPGWYGIDVNYLHGSTLTMAGGSNATQFMGDGDQDLASFRRLRPVAMIGYSTYIYHVSR